MEYIGWVATNPQLAELEAKVQLDGVGSLTQAESNQWNRYVGGQLREWENSFYQSERGLFTEDEFEARRELWRFLMVEAPESAAYRAFWARVRLRFAPGFRAEIDRIVEEVAN